MTPCRRPKIDPPPVLLALIGREEEGVLSVEDWAEIRRLHRAEGLSIKMISRVLKVSRNTVRSALASDAAPRYERRPVPSIVDSFEPRIRELLQVFPMMPATVIAERVGWTGAVALVDHAVRAGLIDEVYPLPLLVATDV